VIFDKFWIIFLLGNAWTGLTAPWTGSTGSAHGVHGCSLKVSHWIHNLQPKFVQPNRYFHDLITAIESQKSSPWRPIGWRWWRSTPGDCALGGPVSWPTWSLRCSDSDAGRGKMESGSWRALPANFLRRVDYDVCWRQRHGSAEPRW
jgi:hypothetical protein